MTRFSKDRQSWDSDFSTYLGVFTDPTATDELGFERLLWRQLQSLHDLDSAGWDPTVSADPSNADFAFSFGGEAFFIVGLHAGSSRWTRRFAWPVLVFNPHEQFQRLRADGAMNRMQSLIRAREFDLQGSLNPNLSDFGELPAARQYSGRPVEEDWRCPFQP